LSRLINPLLVLLAIVVLAVPVAAADNWPTFRGPDGQGVVMEENPPVEWSETKHVTWKTPIRGKAWSTPIVINDQIWLTTAPADGTTRSAICVDKNTGKIIHDIKLFDVADPQFCHDFNSYASPSPVVDPADPSRVYITFGTAGTACLDTQSGEVLWTQRSLKCDHFRGAGASPVLFENLLILPYDGADHQFIAAMDRRTGEVVWKTDRSVDFEDLEPDGTPRAGGDFRKAFASPRIFMHDGRPVLLSPGSKAGYAYDPRTGEELWRYEEKSNHSTSSTPVIGDELVFFATGLSRGQLWAVKPGGSGVINDSHVKWTQHRGAPKKPSTLYHDGLLYVIDDGGIATCFEAKTGKTIWRGRTPGPVSASPILASGRIYVCNETGTTTILKAGRTYEVLAENKLDEGFMASPVAVDDALYLRTKTHLYRIER